jgi:hypothetical protein
MASNATYTMDSCAKAVNPDSVSAYIKSVRESLLAAADKLVATRDRIYVAAPVPGSESKPAVDCIITDLQALNSLACTVSALASQVADAV